MAAPAPAPAPLFNAFRSSSPSPSRRTADRPLPNHIPRRNYHIDLRPREKALLEEDPALNKFRSYKTTVKAASKIGNVLTLVAFAACGYQLVVRAVT